MSVAIIGDLDNGSPVYSISDVPHARPLRRSEAAAFLTDRGYRVAASTLAKYATIGGGPVFESFGRRPLYKPSDLLAWVAQRSSGPRRSTSEQVAA